MSNELVWDNDTIYVLPKIEKPIKMIFANSVKIIDNNDGTFTVIKNKI